MIGDSDQTGARRRVETYDLVEPRYPVPPLPGEVMVAPDCDELIDRMAAELVVHAENCVREFGDFHVALSGGPDLERLYERLMYDPNYRRLPWRRTHLWFVDELTVEPDDERSNFHMIHETIGLHADIPSEQFHPIDATSSRADVEYEKEIKETLSWREKGQDRLDCVLLGLGRDGEIGGLVPGCDALAETRRFVRFSSVGAARADARVTMTFHLINAARLIMVMGVGSDHAPAVHRATDPDVPVRSLPAKGIAPLSGELKWYLDAGAVEPGS